MEKPPETGELRERKEEKKGGNGNVCEWQRSVPGCSEVSRSVNERKMSGGDCRSCTERSIVWVGLPISM